MRRLRPNRLMMLASATVAGVLTTALLTASPSSAAVPATADYQLQGNRVSSVKGAPALTDVGTGNTFSATKVDTTVNRKVLNFTTDSGLQVKGLTGLVKPTVYSIAFLYRPTTNSGYQRLLDFNDGAGETGLYLRSGDLDAYPDAAGTGAPIDTTSFHQIVFTRSSDATITGYVDGAKQFSFVDTGGAWTIPNNDIRFFRDNSGENGAGQVARIRLFSTALSTSQVTALDRLPATTADLAVSLTDAPDPVLHGALMAYTAAVINNGPAAAAASSVTLTLPTGATFVGSSPSVGTCAAPVGVKVTCSLGTLAASAKATVLVVVKAPTATGTITGSTTVSTSTTDSATGNNSASVSATVR